MDSALSLLFRKRRRLPPGASYWFDSACGLNLTGTTINSWTDRIGGIVATPPAAGNKPLLYQAYGKNYIAFDGGTDYFTIANGLSVDMRSSTILMVMRHLPRAQNQVILNLGQSTDNVYFFAADKQLYEWNNAGRATGMFGEDNVNVICGIQSSSAVTVSMNNEQFVAAANSAGVLTGGFIGEWSAQPTFPTLCFMLGIVIYPFPLSSEKANAAKYFLSDYYKATPPQSSSVFCYTGDSITKGIGVGPIPGDFDELLLNYPNQAANLLPGYPRRYVNVGVSGAVINAGSVGGAYIGTTTTTDFFTRTANATKWTVCIGIGSNDIEGGRSSAQIIADLNTWLAAIRAAKPAVFILVNTIIPRNTFDAAEEVKRLAVNTAIRDGTVTRDAVVDMAGIPEIVLSDATVYFEGIHLTAKGYSYMANLNASVLVANNRI